MAGDATPTVLRHVESLFRDGTAAGLTDGQLLGRFADDPGGPAAEVAFAALVDRHGAMVLRVCRQVLGDEHEAQDASQATFLVLARRAGSIARRESVASWLHGVAVRVASKARSTAIRRKARERRRVEMEAGHAVEADSGRTMEGEERRAELHEELGRLPDAFRAPLVLCYLEGLTQEQAAARLRCRLGTLQSRLARGRAKLKARLARRGVALPAGLLGAGSAAAPEAWAEATVRAAIRFTTKSGAAALGEGPASAALAREVLKAMTFTKIKLTLGAALAAVAASGAAVLAWSAKGPDPKAPDEPKVVAKPAVPARPRPTPPAVPNRSLRGVVRDEQGRPVARAWVGSDPRPMQDTWDNPSPKNLRERAEPYRDEHGDVVPPGEVGKYFEIRTETTPWRPVHPDDIRPWEPVVFGGDGKMLTKEEVARDHSAYSVRVARGGWWMAAALGNQDAVRTDDEGRFSVQVMWPGQSKLHFASADYTLQTIRPLKEGDLDAPIEVTLRPTRLVRARVVEVPQDDPRAHLNWTIATVDADGKAAEWQQWMLPNPNAGDPPHVKRRLEVRLPAGRYKVVFGSTTVHRASDFEVPAGEGPYDLPEFTLLTKASARMAGGPAAEIEATGLDGRPVALADYRGKVVVLDFWATWCGPCIGALPKLAALKERFKDQPLVVLALHDASVASADDFRAAFAPIRRAALNGKDLPFPVLLDRPPVGISPRPFPAGAGQKGSGRTADLYEIDSWPSTFVIDRNGILVGRFDSFTDALEGALEDQFGLPRTKPAPAVASGRLEPPKTKGPTKVAGKVIGPDGRPVAGAKLQAQMTQVLERDDIRTGPDGAFAFTAQGFFREFSIKVEAEGLASQMFKTDEDGQVREPLRLGLGTTVIGRLVRDGKPVANAPVGLAQVDRGMDHYLGDLEGRTDAQGRFRIGHVYTDEEFLAYASTGKLPDRGAVVPRRFKTGGEGTSVDLGDLEVRPGRTLAGRIVFSDGRAIPPKTKVLGYAEGAGGVVWADLDGRGRFEIRGLPECEVGLGVKFPDISTWHLPGYRLSAKNKCMDPLNRYRLMGQLPRDITDLVVLFEPGEDPPLRLDPGPLADFKEAKAGPITGAPPGELPAK